MNCDIRQDEHEPEVNVYIVKLATCTRARAIAQNKLIYQKLFSIRGNKECHKMANCTRLLSCESDMRVAFFNEVNIDELLQRHPTKDLRCINN